MDSAPFLAKNPLFNFSCFPHSAICSRPHLDQGNHCMTLILTAIFGLAAGYLASVLTYLFLNLALATAAPQLISSRGHFRSAFLLANCVLWLLCAAFGGYLAASLSIDWIPWLPVAALAIALAAVTWKHPLEARRQLGGASRLLMSAASLAGVALGYCLKVIPT
jgi:hypothetical protein